MNKKLIVMLTVLAGLVLCSLTPSYAGQRIKTRSIKTSGITYMFSGLSPHILSIGIVNPSTTTVVYDVFYTSQTALPGTAPTKLMLGQLIAFAGLTSSAQGDDFKYWNPGVNVSSSTYTGHGSSVPPLQDCYLVIRYED